MQWITAWFIFKSTAAQYIYLMTLSSSFLKCQSMPAVQQKQPRSGRLFSKLCVCCWFFVSFLFFFTLLLSQKKKSERAPAPVTVFTFLAHRVKCISQQTVRTNAASFSFFFVLLHQAHRSTVQLFDLGLNLGNCSGWLGGIEVETVVCACLSLCTSKWQEGYLHS